MLPFWCIVMSTALDLLADVCRSGWTSVAESKEDAEALRLKSAAAANALIAASEHPHKNHLQLKDAIRRGAVWAGLLRRLQGRIHGEPQSPNVFLNSAHFYMRTHFMEGVYAAFGGAGLGTAARGKPEPVRRDAAAARGQVAAAATLLNGLLACLESLQPPSPDADADADEAAQAAAADEADEVAQATAADSAAAAARDTTTPVPAPLPADAPAPEPSSIELVAAAFLLPLRDLDSFHPASNSSLATTAGYTALAASCACLGRLLRLASRRAQLGAAAADAAAHRRHTAAAGTGTEAGSGDAGQPAASQPHRSSSAGEEEGREGQVERKDPSTAPLDPRATVGFAYSAAAVLSYYAPQPPRRMEEAERAAWDAVMELLQSLYQVHDQLAVMAHYTFWDMLEGQKEFRYCAFACILDYQAYLANHIPSPAALAAAASSSGSGAALEGGGQAESEASAEEAAKAAASEAGEAAAWRRSVRLVLELMAGPLSRRLFGVYYGTSGAGPSADYSDAGVSTVLQRSIRLLQALQPAALPQRRRLHPAAAPLGSAPAGFSMAGCEDASPMPLVQQHTVALLAVQAVCQAPLGEDNLEHPGSVLSGVCGPLASTGLAALLPQLPRCVNAVLGALCRSRAALEAGAPRSMRADGRQPDPVCEQLCVEWRWALHRVVLLACSLGLELELADGPGTAGTSSAGEGSSNSMAAAASSASAPCSAAARRGVAAAQASAMAGAWPPADAAALASAAEATLRLLGAWHSMRSVLLPDAATALSTDTGSTFRWLRLIGQRLPTAARQLVSAARKAVVSLTAPSADCREQRQQGQRQLSAALPALLAAASASCKLVQLVACEPSHWTLLGVHSAGVAGPPRVRPAPPYQPLATMLEAAGAAAAAACTHVQCNTGDAGQGSVEQTPEGESEHTHRRVQGLLLQLCSAVEAGLAAGLPGAKQQLAGATGGLRVVLGALLRCCSTPGPSGSSGSIEAAVAEGPGWADAGGTDSHVPQDLSTAFEAAGLAAPLARQAALAALPCAHAACTTLGVGPDGSSAFRAKRCSGCRISRYCSASVCQKAAWTGGHRAACKRLSAAAVVPQPPPALSSTGTDRAAAAADSAGQGQPGCSRLPLLCPLCLAELDGSGAGAAAAAEHASACLLQRRQQMARVRQEHGGSPAAAAAALPEFVWERQEAEERKRRMEEFEMERREAEED